MPLPQHHISNLFVLAGLSGSGKTAIINQFIQSGHQAINIESLCRHDGSVFATLQYPSQPSSYEFHKQLNKLWNRFDLNKPVFIERELNKLGRINLPGWLHHQINTAPVIWLDASYLVREKRIVTIIKNTSPTYFLDCLNKLEKKIGKEDLDLATRFLQQGAYEPLAKILMDYYDHVPGYAYPGERIIANIPVTNDDPEETAKQILAFVMSRQTGKPVMQDQQAC